MSDVKWEWRSKLGELSWLTASVGDSFLQVEQLKGDPPEWYWQATIPTPAGDYRETHRGYSVSFELAKLSAMARVPLAVENKPLVTPQAPPQESTHPPVWALVAADMNDRDAEGRRKYGVPLRPWNGRDALIDAYQEALDLCVYLRQAIYERDGK